MYTWTRPAIVAATLLTGCTGQIGSPTPGDGQRPNNSANTDGGVTPIDTDNDGVPDGVDLDGDGMIDGDGVDTDGDGVIDGIDTDGDGIIDTPIDDTPTTPVSSCTPGIVPGSSQLPLLTNAQYDNTIRDLVGLDTQPSSMLAPDGQIVDQRKWDGYQTAAASVASQIMADPTARARAIPCTPDADGSACAGQMIAEFGQRAFRRPLTTEETARFQNLYTNRAQLTETGTFDEAAQLILEAMLSSPNFLARAETAESQMEGSYYVLNGYEVASRLSYMLWGSTPDDALLASAAAGNLNSSAGILGEAQRMLQDPKARSQVAAFHRQYAHMGPSTRWVEYSRDPNIYPLFSEARQSAASAETERLFDYMTFDSPSTFQQLLTTQTAFVNADLAPIYGLDATQFGAEFQPVELDASRAGIFTRAGFLAAYSVYDRPSSILRGAFLQKEVLCTTIGAPPAGASNTPLPMDANLTTDRDRVQAQTADPVCASCHHTLINPTGFALGAFDAVGAYQPTENGVSIDTTGTVPVGATSADVTGSADLMQAIANSPEAQRCYAQKWVKYAYQREQNSADACVVDNLASKIVGGNYTIVNLIADLTQSDSFRLRALETETGL